MTFSKSGDRIFDLRDWSQVCPGVPGTVLWIGPIWATLCGMIASGGWSEAWNGERFVTALVVVLLAGPIAGAMNALALGLGVAAEVGSGPDEDRNPARVKQLPYAVPTSISARWSLLLGETRERWIAGARTPAWQYMVGFGVVSAVALILAGFLAGMLLYLMVGALVAALVLGSLGRIAGRRDYWLLFSSQVMLGWLLGQGLVRELDYLSVAMSVLLGATCWAILTCTGERRAIRLVLSYIFQLVGSVLLILAGLPIGAGSLMLLLGIQLLFRAGEWAGVAYARRVQPLIMLTMLVISIAIGGSVGG